MNPPRLVLASTPIWRVPGVSDSLAVDLAVSGIVTLEDLKRASVADLLSVPHIDIDSFKALGAVLSLQPPAQHGLSRFDAMRWNLRRLMVISEDGLISQLPLSTRAWNGLRRIGVRTIWELTQRTEADLLAINGFGQGSLENVIVACETYLKSDGRSRVRSRSSLGPTARSLRAMLDSNPEILTERTLRDIGDDLGVSRERVRQILLKLGISKSSVERRGRADAARQPIPQDDPGYVAYHAAYARALSRGASESVARNRASAVRSWYAKGREQWLARYHGDEDYRAEYLKASQERRNVRYREDADYRARLLDQRRKRYHEDPDLRARALGYMRQWQARKREERQAGHAAAPRRTAAPIPQDDPGYAAYARALSRGASESVARDRASNARRYYTNEEFRRRRSEAAQERYHEDPDYRARRLASSRERQARKREGRQAAPGRTAAPISQDDPYYAAYHTAYARALSRGESESKARSRARLARRYYTDEEYRKRRCEAERERYHEDPGYRARKLASKRERRAQKRADRQASSKAAQ